MIKKFLSQNSKYPVIDFLLWLIIYPFVIVFAVAFVAFIFSFSEFKGAKITDWISSISAFIAMGFTGGLLIVTAKAAKSWREQRLPDARSAIIENLITYDGIINNLMVEFNHAGNAIRYEKILTTYLSLFNQLSIIESSIMKYYLFDLTQKKEVDELYLKLRDRLNDFAKEVSKYLNSSIKGKDITLNPDIIEKSVLMFTIIDKLKFDKVLNKSLDASFTLLSKIAGDNVVIKPNEKNNGCT